MFVVFLIIAASFLAKQLTGALSVFVKHLDMFVNADGGISARTLDGSGDLPRDVIVDIISNIRAALFFAVQEIKVGSCEQRD